MAYRDQLAGELTSGYFTYFSRVSGHRRLDVAEVLKRAAGNAVIYVCGPVALIEAVRSAADRLGIVPKHVQYESFY